MQAYSSYRKRKDRHSLPDVSIVEFTAREVAEQDDDMVYEYTKRHEFRLAHMSGAVCEKMFDAMIEEEGITGGWMWAYCLPGCMPDSSWFGPFKTYRAAHADMRRTSAE